MVSDGISLLLLSPTLIRRKSEWWFLLPPKVVHLKPTWEFAYLGTWLAMFPGSTGHDGHPTGKEKGEGQVPLWEEVVAHEITETGQEEKTTDKYNEFLKTQGLLVWVQ